MMRFRYLTCLLFLFAWLPFWGNAQETKTNIHLTVEVQGAIPNTPAYLSYYFMGEDLKTYDLQIDAQGRYHFQLEDGKGYYRFVFGKKDWELIFPLFYSEEELTLTTSVEDPSGDAHIVGAPEAETYLNLLREYRLFEDANWGIGALRRMFGDQAPVVLQTKELVNKHYYEKLAKLVGKKENIYPTNAVAIYYIRDGVYDKFENWWPDGWFTFPLVTLDPEFSNHVRRFFQYYKHDEYSYTKQLSVYADLLRRLLSCEYETINMLMLQSELIDIFKGNVYDVLLDSMAKYQRLQEMDSIYHSEPRETERLLTMKHKDLAGKELQMVDKKAQYTLLILWSDNCTHCQALMPKLWEVCRGRDAKKLAVRAICIDEDTPSRRDYIRSRGWEWKNLIEHDNGESQLLEALNADGTPALFLLDKSGHLVARPEDEKQLRAELEERL